MRRLRLNFQQRFEINEVLKLAGILYLLRVPLLLFLIAAVMTWGGLSPNGPGAKILEGIYDVAWQPKTAESLPDLKIALRFLLLTLSALLFAVTIAASARNILRCLERFEIKIPDEDTPTYRGLRLLYTIPPLLLAITIIAGATLKSPISLVDASVGDLLGLVLFGLFMRFGYRFRHPNPRIFVIISVAGFLLSLLGREWYVSLSLLVLVLIVWAYHQGVEAVNRDPARWIVGSPVGYTHRTRENKLELKGNHLVAAHAFSLSLMIYGSLFAMKSVNPFANSSYPLIPTLSVLLMLGVLICWALCGFSFFLDRYRIPLILPLLVYGSFTSVFPQSDHFVSVFPDDSKTTVPAAELLSTEPGGPPVILVAITGGGIRATAWSARVLRNLQLASGDEARFRKSVRLISSVSGGSVGSMYFADSYTNGDSSVQRVLHPTGGFSLDENDPVLIRAQESSLDDIAVELAYQDTLLGLTPFFRGLDFQNGRPLLISGRFIYEDRGAAFEKAIQRGPDNGESIRRATLNSWREDAKNRLRPAIIFNASLVESGKRLLFATTTLAPVNTGRIQFSRQFPGMNINIAAAARLSATFPIVSPAARPLKQNVFELSDHIVDGGYTDDYGMASLVEWLDEGLTAMNDSSQKPKKVMIVEIRSSSEAPEKAHRNQLGFIFQTINPVLTLANARETGQLSHNELERNLLRDKWKQDVAICHVVFQTPRDNRIEPLNWHLTAPDLDSLRAAWNKEQDSNAKTVAGYLRGEDVPCN